MRPIETVIVFAITYAGMALGRIPGLRVDRAGVALLAAIAVYALGLDAPGHILHAIDFPTLGILFSLMLVSGKLAVAGFYDACALWIGRASVSPATLLALVVAVAGGLSALLTNDVVVFALTPLLCAGIRHRGLDARPYLIALAAASNAGSAATIIGNPQNVLIGQVGNLAFLPFLAACAAPAALGLAVTFAVIWLMWRRRLATDADPAPLPEVKLDRVHTLKGWLAVAGIVAVFLAPIPKLHGVMAIAGLLILSRRIETRRMLGFIDWPLLVLFVSLFIVTGALAATGLPERAIAALRGWGILPERLSVLAPLALVGSNTIGNVPLVTLLLASWPNMPPDALLGLAALSTLAGNLLLVGSIANIIVVERAEAAGVKLGFREHAACGIPITLLSMALAVGWLALIGLRV
jgi:Na+/H+ antiporter NhaD/arsenite permease-like protein